LLGEVYVSQKIKYMDLEIVNFIKVFSVLLRKVGQTQTWHKTMK